MDVLNRVLKWIDHNRYLAMGIIVCLIMVGFAISTAGCQSKTAGLLDDQPVARADFNRQIVVGQKDLATHRARLDAEIVAFNAEVDAFNQRIDDGYDDLDRQDAMKQAVVNKVGEMAIQAATTGTVNWKDVLLGSMTVGSISLGLGAGLDNRRKDKVITAMKTTGGDGADDSAPCPA